MLSALRVAARTTPARAITAVPSITATLAALRRPGPTASLLRAPLAVTARYASNSALKKGKKEKEHTPLVRLDEHFKTFKPRTPGLRFRRLPRRDHLWKGGPVRALTVAKRNKGGRNNTGRITVRHRGGGHRRRIRLLDWRRAEPGTHEVVRLEYDPGRTAHIALLKSVATEKLSYIVAPDKVAAGDRLVSYMGNKATAAEKASETADIGVMQAISIRPGNCMPLSMVPVGTLVHCIGLHKGGPAQLARAAGTYAQVLQTGLRGYAQLKLSSGEVRRIPVEACATIGTTSNPNHQHRIDGKAGARRWKGWRPTVRGSAMNKVDHPNGGGRGKSKGGHQPKSPWGKLAKGGTTRRIKNPLVVKPRPRR
ncbi:translation protein SH3-like domain-containing protein [Thamnocephalis sphaerospora]|uniref:Large ribosomal subunit protein uL2m n=1 Tax=Thamnocephalis sphaerospora TaxID=78915 RepID=A0A4P9XXM5_9FUNG|nr:translation protein SH3-like domain-containing protein [Thamnocephalis sphaerospora]|eukprot:RKP11074.1 translation protein SH3-like domain-containing protein [Thamnocephalis sphaerospora]